eukprot:TRINITY_DN257_c0_g1_i2.p1 TRINITY_DN257_c0_g1~~TRINITY_DN257_c0_g1_i2.p1  ORF type:complete len:381 (-),score=94.33 TRINITY_DN257_c0_g1_i2:736-1878(-)
MMRVCVGEEERSPPTRSAVRCLAATCAWRSASPKRTCCTRLTGRRLRHGERRRLVCVCAVVEAARCACRLSARALCFLATRWRRRRLAAGRRAARAMFASITLSVAGVDGTLRVRRSDGDLQLADLRNESDNRLRELVRVEQLAHGKGAALWFLLSCLGVAFVCARTTTMTTTWSLPTTEHRPSICRGLCACVDCSAGAGARASAAPSTRTMRRAVCLAARRRQRQRRRARVALFCTRSGAADARRCALSGGAVLAQRCVRRRGGHCAALCERRAERDVGGARLVGGTSGDTSADAAAVRTAHYAAVCGSGAVECSWRARVGRCVCIVVMAARYECAAADRLCELRADAIAQPVPFDESLWSSPNHTPSTIALDALFCCR